VGQLRTDESAADAKGYVVRLVSEALCQFQSAAEQALEVKIYDRLLLSPDRSLCDSGVQCHVTAE
jgi:hypothetical protein